MTGLTRRGAIGGLAAFGVARPALAQSQTTIRIAYPAWDSKQQEQAVTGIFRAYEARIPT